MKITACFQFFYDHPSFAITEPRTFPLLKSYSLVSNEENFSTGKKKVTKVKLRTISKGLHRSYILVEFGLSLVLVYHKNQEMVLSYFLLSKKQTR